MGRDSNKRKKLFIKSGFQTKFIILALLPLFLSSMLTLAALFYGLELISTSLAADSLTDPGPFLRRIFGSEPGGETLISHLKTAALLLVILTTLVTASLVTAVFIFFSHRIAGPLVRFEAVMQNIFSGDLRHEVRLREDDELQETAAKFNETMNAISDRLRRIDQFNTFTINIIDELLENAEEDEAAKLQKVKSATEGISESINEFKFR